MHRCRARLRHLGATQSQFYAHKANVKLDDSLAYDGTGREPMVPRISGPARI